MLLMLYAQKANNEKPQNLMEQIGKLFLLLMWSQK